MADAAYAQALKQLASLERFGVKLGLERMERALELLGSPHRAYPTIHIAGTNGKGSTAAMLAACLGQRGRVTGLYTSPHLCRFTERIVVGGREIPRAAAAELVRRILDMDLGLTFFEVVTAMAFAHFAAAGVDVAVVETGLGGRLDATNVIEPDICVLTPIALDHTEVLGDRLELIAAEKAGIVKGRAPVVSARQDGAAAAVIRRRCASRGAPLLVEGEDFSFSDRGGARFDFSGQAWSVDGLELAVSGPHQRQNAALCLAALEQFSLGGGDVTEADCRRGIAGVRWPGRMERIGRHLLDGAHNPAGTRALARALREQPDAPEELCLVMGVLGDRPLAPLIQPLLGLAGRIIFTRPGSPRARAPEDLARELDGAEVATDLAAALAAARADPRPCLITGSLYLVGEARAILLGERMDPWPVGDPLAVPR